MNMLKGQNALVTGASGGIGGAVAKALHAQGAHVYISGSNEEKLQALGAELGYNYTIKPCNLESPIDVAKLVEDIAELQILVCNAGITKDNLLIRMSDDDFDKVLAINLKASFILNREAVKKMIKARYGRIVNIASVVGVSGNPGQVNYCASKAGLIGMTKSIAQEVASRNITANIVAPGFINTNMTSALTDAQKEAILQKIPVKNMGLPEDISHAVTFLCNPHSSYITGHTLHVNGGMLMA